MKKSSFVEGTFIATFAIILVKIMGMLYVIPFYAIVGTTGAALYAYAYNIYNIFLDISTVGLPIAMSKITNEFNTLKMYDAKARSYHLAINFMKFVSVFMFIILFIFAKPIATLIIGNLEGGNTIEDVCSVIRVVSFSILIIPYLSITKGYLQGHHVMNISSISNILEQLIRIIIVIFGSYLMIKVFNKSVVLGVEVALSGAFFGGLAAYIFIKLKMRDNKEDLSLGELKTKDKISNKEIVKKIANYAIPYIIINSISSLYSSTDMILVLRGLGIMGYDASNVEFIATSISTWAAKINMIVISIAMGMTMSLIPAIVHSFTLKRWDDVNKKINTAYKMILFISLPMAIGISMLSREIWTIFYGYNEIGGTILSMSVFVGVCINLYMVTSSILQSLNFFKAVYLSSLIGLMLNALMDIPFMHIFNSIGIPSYLGALFSSIVGYSLSVIIALLYIKYREKNIKYRDSIITFFKMLIPNIIMIIIVLLIRYIYPINYNSILNILVYIGINGIIGGVSYIFISYKMGLVYDVFGDDLIKMLKQKFKR